MRSAILLAAAILGGATSDGLLDRQGTPAPQCKPAGSVTGLPDLREASGLAVSRRVPGRLWAHNDSGKPVLFALDARGSVTGRVEITGATLEDWEAIAVGPCAGGSCLYVGDIGDNSGRRASITVYRAPEPGATDTSIAVKDALRATYPDGAHDAETLLVTPDGGIFIVTKGDAGPVALYRFPRALRSGATHVLEAVGKPREAADRQRITDGAVSPNGEWVILRSGRQLTFHRTSELVAGNWRVAATVDLEPLGEAQGEGVAMAADNTVYLIGEAGGHSRGGTFARLTCTREPQE
jgi:hypothetical protein